MKPQNSGNFGSRKTIKVFLGIKNLKIENFDDCQKLKNFWSFQASKLQESLILDSSQNSKRILKSKDFDSTQKLKVFETFKLRRLI